MTKLAVIGAGSMGANHVRTARSLREWDEVVVVDVDKTRAKTVAGTHYFAWTTQLDEIAEQVDAAVVAVPTVAHEQVVVPLLEAGTDVLLEKPVAADLESAERIAAAAAASSSRVLIGHVERFNSAVTELLRWAPEALHVECRRVGPSGGRALGDVVSDLMVHDLDLVRAIGLARDGDVTMSSVSALWSAGSEEMCSALLGTEAGLTATVVASRAGQMKDRTVILTGKDFQVTADLVRQQVAIHRLERNEFVVDGGVRFRQTGTTEIPFLDSGEPLQREQRHFYAVVTQDEAPIVPVEQGVDVMRLVEQVRAAAGPARAAIAG